MLTTVLLGGPLGKKYGKRFQFKLHRPVDVIKAMQCNFEDFVDTLQGLAEKGMQFRITQVDGGRQDMTLEDIAMTRESKVIRLSPVVAGASEQTSKANTQLAISVVLAVAAVVVSQGAAGPWAATYLTSALAASSISFAIQGALGHYSASQWKKNKRDARENKPSATFSNQENVTEAGGPVPVGYGQMLIGSTVVGVAYEIYELPAHA